MTCIVGLVEDGKVYIGGDSAGTTSNHDSYLIREDKVFKRGPFIFGCAGSYRGLQLLKHAVSIGDLKAGQSLNEYLNENNISFESYLFSVVENIRETFKEMGHSEISENEEYSGTIGLIGVNGRLFRFESNFSTLEVMDNYTAIGSGEAYAVGSLYENTTNKIFTPAEKVRSALECAEKFNSSIRGPFKIICLNEDESYIDCSTD